MNRSRESVRPSHVIGCVLASLILGCASTAEPVYTLSDRGYKNNLSKADSYCIRAEEEVRPKGGSSTLEFVGLIGMITGGLMAGGGSSFFIAEATKAAPDAKALTGTGAVGTIGAVVGGISAVVYAFANKSEE